MKINDNNNNNEGYGDMAIAIALGVWTPQSFFEIKLTIANNAFATVTTDCWWFHIFLVHFTAL